MSIPKRDVLQTICAAIMDDDDIMLCLQSGEEFRCIVNQIERGVKSWSVTVQRLYSAAPGGDMAGKPEQYGMDDIASAWTGLTWKDRT